MPFFKVSVLHTRLPGGTVIKNSPFSTRDAIQYLGWEDPLEVEMATHSSMLAWRMPWTEETGRPQSWGSKEQTQLSD